MDKTNALRNIRSKQRKSKSVKKMDEKKQTIPVFQNLLLRYLQSNHHGKPIFNPERNDIYALNLGITELREDIALRNFLRTYSKESKTAVISHNPKTPSGLSADYLLVTPQADPVFYGTYLMLEMAAKRPSEFDLILLNDVGKRSLSEYSHLHDMALSSLKPKGILFSTSMAYSSRRLFDEAMSSLKIEPTLTIEDKFGDDIYAATGHTILMWKK